MIDTDLNRRRDAGAPAAMRGGALVPKDGLAGRIAASGQDISNSAKLGDLLFGRLGVMALKPDQLQFLHTGAWRSYADALRNLAGSARGRDALENLHANATGQIQAMLAGYKPFADAPGTHAARQMNLARPGAAFPVRERTGAEWEAANHFGQNIGKEFGELPPGMQSPLSRYAISPAGWDALRNVPNHDRDSHSTLYLTPNAAARTSDSAIGTLAPDRVAAASGAENADAIRGHLRENLARKLAALYSELSGRAASANAPYVGELLGQPRSWAPAAIRQLWRRAPPESGHSGALKALAGDAAAMTAMGAVRSAHADATAGKTPDLPNGDAEHDARLLARWIAEGGNLGLFGDYIHGAMARAGKSGASVNPFYTRLIADWLLLDRFQEQAMPGYLARYQSNRKRRAAREFFLPVH